jgi:DNA polymerase III epsilon subunit-like protein
MSTFLDKQWADIPIVVLDTETTGVRNSDTVCEVSIGVACRGEIEDIYTTYVDPMQPIPAEVTRIHGITDSMVKGAPLLSDVAPKILEYLHMGLPLVAHGLAFDVRMLCSEPLIADSWPRDVPTLCTMDYVRFRDPMTKLSLPDFRLGTVSTMFGLYKERKSMHRAEADVYALGELIPRLMRTGVVRATMTKWSHEWREKKPSKSRGR